MMSQIINRLARNRNRNPHCPATLIDVLLQMINFFGEWEIDKTAAGNRAGTEFSGVDESRNWRRFAALH